jgi:hypothetical protein
MALADAQQQRLLELLREAGEEPVAFAELHAGGISFPAAVISELELNGYPIERVYDHGRLVGFACSIQNAGTHPPHTDGADDHGRTNSRPRISRSADRPGGEFRLASAHDASPAVGAWGGAQLAARRMRASRYSRGRRPSGSDSEARDHHAALPQPNPSGVDGRSTQTQPRHACRLQRPCSPLIVRGSRG